MISTRGEQAVTKRSKEAKAAVILEEVAALLGGE